MEEQPAAQEQNKEYSKPFCPKCGRYNIRFRVGDAFKDKQFLCNLCGHEWKKEDQ